MKNRKGAAFIIVVVLSAFILLLAGLMAILTQAYYKNQAKNLSVDKALTVAEKGLAALTSASWTYIPDPITKVDERPGVVDNFSFYLTKVEAPVQFSVNGSPDGQNAPLLENEVTYDLFTVYCIGVITNGPSLTTLGTGEGLTAKLDHLATTGTSGTGITVSSERAISSTVVEKETYPGVKAYDSNISYSGDGTETVTYGGDAYICILAYPSNYSLILPAGVILPTDGNYWSPSPLPPTLVFVPNNADPIEISTDHLPRVSDWEKITLAQFVTGGGPQGPPPRHVFTAAVSGPITIAAVGGGTVTPTTTILTYAGGAVPITATPAAGYHLANWAVTVNPSYISITNTGAAATSIAATNQLHQGDVGTVTATFAANRGTVTITAGPNGTVLPATTTLTYNDGVEPTITAIANAGYHFASWAVTGNVAYVKIADPSSGTTTLRATSSMPNGGTAKVTATFAANVSGTITIAAGPNGTVSPTTTTLTYNGSAVAITATPEAGYAFVSWTVIGNAGHVNLVNASTAATIIKATSSLPQGGTATVTATFAANISGPITITAGANGRVTPTSTAGLTYLGSAVAITATPDGGYHFVAWAGTINATYVSLANANLEETTLAATSSLPQGGLATVTATFAANDSAPIAIAAGANGTVAPTSTTLTYGGAAVTITATAAAGYHFANWAGTNNADYVSIVDISTAATTITATNSMPQGGTATVTATFAANISGTITITAGTGGTISPTSITGLTYLGSVVAIMATPNTGYYFVGWAVTVNPTDVNLTSSGSAATTISATSSMPQGGTARVTATFAGNGSGAITITAGEGGSVTPTATTLTYTGSAGAITANPNAGYHFVGWAVTVNPNYVNLTSSGSAATTLAATSSMPQGGTATVTATFAANVSGTITIMSGDNGTVTPTSTTLTYMESAVIITATPSVGYHFVSWAVTVNPTYINITNASAAETRALATSSLPQGGIATVTATFAINTFTLTYIAGANGAISGTSSQMINYGAAGTAVTAVPNAGYYFVNWSDARNTNPRIDANVIANVTVTANFSTNWTHIGAELTGYTGPGGAEVMPSGIEGITITSIRASALDSTQGHLLTGVTIPNSITSIGTYAFNNCIKLTRVTIPNSVTSIGDDAFQGCLTLTSVTIGRGLTSISASAFQNCTALTSVTIPNNIISIGDYAFAGCGLTSATIPNSVTFIGIYVFQGCLALTSVIIPTSITSTSTGMFYGCTSLTSVTIPNNLTSIGRNTFGWCAALTTMTIPNSVTSIGSGAFGNCTGLTSVTIGSGVNSIDGGAFAVCTSLTSVTIPASVTSIGGVAFYGCTGLTSVTIPDSVTSIGDAAFSNCSKLAITNFLGDAPTGATNVFETCKAGFYIHRLAGATGWGPTWYGYPVVTP